MWNDRDVHLHALHPRYRQADAFDGDGSFFYHVLGKLLWKCDCEPIVFASIDLAQRGEMSDAVFASQRALPAVALAHGYHFRYPEIEIAFRGIYGDA